jgi:hypothetical protein
LWATFDKRVPAEQCGAQRERLVGQGIVPSALLEQASPKPQSWTVGRCIAEYLRHNAVPESDVKLLDTIRPALALPGTSTLTYDWAEAWVGSMKRSRLSLIETFNGSLRDECLNVHWFASLG